MIRTGAPALLTAVALVVSGCSERGPSTESAPSTTKTTTNGRSVSAETISACRSLAEDRQLKEFWSWYASNPFPKHPDEHQGGAISAVKRLLRYSEDPLIDDVVRSTMKTAASDAELMAEVWVQQGTLDVERLRLAVTPVVQACQAQDIDMAVPD